MSSNKFIDDMKEVMKIMLTEKDKPITIKFDAGGGQIFEVNEVKSFTFDYLKKEMRLELA